MPVNRKFKTQDLDTPAHKRRDLKADPDLATSITGMFRVLDLISESGRLAFIFDKIIIAQESLKELINVLSPGAYASLTKVDFNALDKLAVKPLGLYGSKTEIIAFLSNRGVISDATSRALNKSTNDISVPHLRSGLYVLRGPNAGPGCQQIFVIYWPEPTTWDDDAISSVRRNRVTFMRYLTKISDQLLCLISPEHARTIAWNEEAQELPMAVDEGSDRLFTFKVAKTNEQDENVSARPGFTVSTIHSVRTFYCTRIIDFLLKMHNPIISVQKPHVECTVNGAELQPILIHGETSQAILTKRFVPGKLIERKISGEPFNAVQLRSLL
ncbi:hypothetical protein B0H16DRAFT_1334407 [Mycena metata]|uniref:Uncharacterized protein n=1 Tax=Mycena metata TaxID=1033252 RepID=A0AAD7HLZ5_9AGAR|nr:hypothetical protein B0H16DRAFT_1334407 [Mycena metata]